ncbi:MAG TPA: chemotaxis protein CheW [Myxococcota bacterium]
MDILSARKKKKAGEPQAPPPTPTTTPTTSSTAPTAPTPPTPPTTTVAPPTELSVPAFTPPTPPPMSTTAPTWVDVRPPPSASVAPRSPPPARASSDPLEGFLARYDDESDVNDQPMRVVESLDVAERYLAFELCGEAYAASIMDVREILTIRSLTEVPRAPREVLGVISKRGLVLPVIDLATTLGLRQPQRRLKTAQRVLVVGEGDRVCGLRVDAVAEVIKLAAPQIEAVPPSLGTRNAGLLLGLGRVGTTMYILLDLPAVLDAFAASVGLSSSRSEGAL